MNANDTAAADDDLALASVFLVLSLAGYSHYSDAVDILDVLVADAEVGLDSTLALECWNFALDRGLGVVDDLETADAAHALAVDGLLQAAVALAGRCCCCYSFFL